MRFAKLLPALLLGCAVGLGAVEASAACDPDGQGGQPYDNQSRLYWGSSNDVRLNRRVVRATADPAALAEVAAHYETTGQLTRPLVTVHTLYDP